MDAVQPDRELGTADEIAGHRWAMQRFRMRQGSVEIGIAGCHPITATAAHATAASPAATIPALGSQA